MASLLSTPRAMSEKKRKLDDLAPEELRERALRPFKPIITDEEVKNFEENVRKQSLENMKKNKEELNAYEKSQVQEKSSFIHHFANNQVP